MPIAGRIAGVPRCPRAFEPPAREFRRPEVHPAQVGRGRAARVRAQRVGEQVLARVPKVGRAPSAERIQQRRLLAFGLLEQLTEEVEDLGARPRKLPALARPVADRLQQVLRDEVLLQRSVGKAEASRLLAGAVVAPQEGGGAQVLFELVRPDVPVAAREVGFGFEPAVKPGLQFECGEGAAAAAPDLGREVRGEAQLVLWLHMVLALVALEPALRDGAVQRHAAHRPARRARGLDFGDVLAHQLERVGAVGQFGEVVHRGHHVHHRVDVRAGQRIGEVAPHLVVRKRQQHQCAVVLGPDVAALFAGEMGLLVAQGAEVLGAAGDEHPRRRRRVGRARIPEQLEQVVGECLSVAFRELDQHFVEAVEQDHGALRGELQYRREFECRLAGRAAPAARDAFVDRRFKRRHAAIQPGDVAQVEIQGRERAGIGQMPLAQLARQVLAGHGLSHAVLAEQREERRRVAVLDPLA